MTIRQHTTDFFFTLGVRGLIVGSYRHSPITATWHDADHRLRNLVSICRGQVT